MTQHPHVRKHDQAVALVEPALEVGLDLLVEHHPVVLGLGLFVGLVVDDQRAIKVDAGNLAAVLDVPKDPVRACVARWCIAVLAYL